MILDKSGKNVQIVTMFHHIAWPDYGVPQNPTTIFQIIHSLSEWNLKCTLVHCSAGVGRTGVFIALIRLIDAIVSNAYDLNIFQTVLNLRENRKFMVMKAEQYRFLYSAISDYMTLCFEDE